MSHAAEGAPSLTRPYNLKLGPIALTASAGFGIDFVDNLNLASTNKTGDIVLSPSLSIQGVWQVTKLNNLDLRMTIGYTKYIDHPNLDTQTALISPDSVIRLNVYVGDIKFVFHEQFSLQEDPVASGGVSGVAKFGRFVNTIGVTGLWDLNDVVWSLGYDHYNFTTTGSSASTDAQANNNVSVLDHSTEQLSTAISLKFGPTTALGLEGTAAYSQYPKNSAADATNYSLGPFLDLQVTRYTHVTLGVGYQIYSSQNGGTGTTPEFLTNTGINGLAANGGATGVPTGSQTGTNRPSGNSNGYYVNLSLVHRLNSFYQDRLSLGREFQVGLLADRTDTTFIRYSSTWAFSRRLALSTSLDYEDVKQTTQFANSFGGASLPNYRFFGGTLTTSYQITKKLSVGLSYQYSRRFSDNPLQEYAQNRFAIQFGYQF